MSLKELNGRLTNQSYLSGYTPSKDDAAAFAELFGGNTAVIQWAARMASYYQAERDELVAPAKKADAPKAAAPAPAVKSPTAAPKPAPAKADDDDVDLFGEETEEETAALAAKKKAEEEKKAAKKAVIAKSSILLDVKPWEDTTNMQELVEKVKAEVIDGLVWGAHKFITVAYGLKKLQILFVIEDDKVSSEDIEDLFTVKYEDYVQSIDIVAWNKI